jgi:di/tricarboxylate transporter
MFDFAPVGAAVALVGVLFIVFFGWRLIPVERSKRDTAKELEDLKGYLSEAKVPESSKVIGTPLRDLDALAEENDVNILGLVRRNKRLPGLARREVVKKNDVIVLEGSPGRIDQFVGAAGLKLASSSKRERINPEAVLVMEVVVPEGAMIEGRSAFDVRLLYRQGVTLLGISRKGEQIRDRVRKAKIKAGDLLLLLGPESQMPDVVTWLGCLPLAGRGLEITERNKAWAAAATFSAALLAASLGLVYLPLALAAVVVVYVALGIVQPSHIYESIEWPVIVLLACMIPIGAALEANGGTVLVADAIVDLTGGLPTVTVLAILMMVPR